MNENEDLNDNQECDKLEKRESNEGTRTKDNVITEMIKYGGDEGMIKGLAEIMNETVRNENIYENFFSAAINSREVLTHKDTELRDLKKSLEAGDYEPFNYREIAQPTSNGETLLHLLKGSLGTGILAMPLAFSHSGFVLGIAATAFVGFLCTFCVHMLLGCQYELCKRRKVPTMTYPTTVECAFQDGPVFFQKIGPYAPHIVNIFLMLYQIGTCTVYTVFIGENIHLVLKENDINIDARWIITVFDICERLDSSGFGIIVYYMARQDIVWEERKAFGSYRDYPLFLGTVLFALEAIGMMIPLQNEMKSPKSFVGICGVLNIGMTTIVVLYIGMGLFGYLAFGPEVGGSISYTIGNAIPAQVGKVLLALAIYISHTLQMYPAIDIVWKQYLQPRLEKNPRQIFYEYAVRTILVFIAFCLGVAVPYVELFISLIGALSLSALGLAFPSLIYISTHWHTLRGAKGTLVITRNIFIVIFAIFGLVVGTSTSLDKIIEKFSGTNNSTNSNV
ncbi:hypothetical protein JTB14_004985 [Gonioctena quinquepunctata]|nr:hypothetical protein JTB14_004985 [Gonioctena quinquepunctata]